jgi:hypothetical protein
MYNTNSDILRKVGYKCSSEVISGRETGIASPKRRNSGIPIPFCPVQILAVNGSQYLKTIINCLVLFFNSSGSFHIGLSKAKENVEVRILRRSIDA